MLRHRLPLTIDNCRHSSSPMAQIWHAKSLPLIGSSSGRTGQENRRPWRWVDLAEQIKPAPLVSIEDVCVQRTAYRSDDGKGSARIDQTRLDGGTRTPDGRANHGSAV